MKVGIVGAGICGLYLGWNLQKRGADVFIFERKREVGKVVCSGLLSEKILEFVPESRTLFENQIDYCLIHFPKKTIKINFKKKFFVIEHSKLDKLAATLAEDAGVKINLNHAIERIPDGFDRIIGCDGANSQIRKILGLKQPVFYLGIQGFVSQKDSSNFVETWPTKEGFLWKIPRRNKIEYGIMEKPKFAKIIFNDFIKQRGLWLENVQAALIPEGFLVPKNNKITLCGDATGIIKPWSGGGIIWGLTAAEILLKTFPDFLKYQKEVKKFFLPQIIFSKIIKKAVYLFGFNFSSILPKEYLIDGDFLFKY